MIKTYYSKEQEQRVWGKCKALLITFSDNILPKGIKLYEVDEYSSKTIR